MLYTFLGGRALTLAVRRPSAGAGRVFVYETGRTRHLVGDAFDAVDELVAHALVPVLVVTVGPGTALGRFRFLCDNTNIIVLDRRKRHNRHQTTRTRGTDDESRAKPSGDNYIIMVCA